MANKIRIIIEGDDKASVIVKKFASSMSNDMEKAEKKTKKLSDGMEGLYRKIIYIAGAYGLGRLTKSFIDTASSMDQMKISLDTLTKGKGEEWFEELNKWALKMPVNTEKAIQSFINMRAMGMEPTIDQMTILVDTMSALGGESEKLERIARALGQMQTKGKVVAQELLQLAEAGVPAYEILREKLGLTAEEIGDIGNQAISADVAIQALMEGMEERYGGQSERIMKTWAGLTESLRSYWVEFQRLVMESGVMDYLEEKLSLIIDRIDEMQRTGDLAEWASDVGEHMLIVLKALTKGVGLFINSIRGIELEFSGFMASIGYMGEKVLAIAEELDKAALWYLEHAAWGPLAEALKKDLEEDLKYTRSLRAEMGHLADAGINMSRDLINSISETDRFFDELLTNVKYIKSELGKPIEVGITGAETSPLLGVSEEAEKAFEEYYEKKNNQLKEILKQMKSGKEAEEKFEKESLDEQTEALDEYYKKANAWLDEYLDKNHSVTEEVKSDWLIAIEGWASDMSSTLNDMLWESDRTFKDIAKAFGKMLTEMLIEKNVIEPLLKIDWGSVFSRTYHSGGEVGAGGSGRYVDSSLFAFAPRLHSGLNPDEYPAILQRGETVIPKGKIENRPINLTQNVNLNNPLFLDQKTLHDTMAEIAMTVQDMRAGSSFINAYFMEDEVRELVRRSP